MAKGVRIIPAQGSIEFLNTQSATTITLSSDTAGNLYFLDGSGNQFFSGDTTSGEVGINGQRFIEGGGTILPVFSSTGAVNNPEEGMVIYNSSDTNIYRYDGSQWLHVFRI